MTGDSFLTRMPAGIPGAITRNRQAQVEPQQFDPLNVITAYGLPVKINTAQLIQQMGGGDTAASAYGVLVRPFPLQETVTVNPVEGTSAPPTAGIGDVLVNGYISVHLYGVTAALRNGQVFIRIANAGAGQIVGGFEAAADGGNTVAPKGWVFMGAADANGNTEIRINPNVG